MFKLLQLREEYSENRDTSIFCSAIRKSRQNQILDKKDSYRWGAPNYKIYPSTITFSTCPPRYLEGCGTFSGITDMTMNDIVRRGSSIHQEYQDDFKRSNVIWNKENINFPEEIREKFEKNWPEVSFFDKESGISGKADGVQNYKGKPLIIELKTTSKLFLEKLYNDLSKFFKTDEEFVDLVLTLLKDKQEELEKIKKEYKYSWDRLAPEASHITQGCLYVAEFRRLGYFKPNPDQFLLVYLNTVLPPSEDQAAKEFLIDYEEYKDETESMIDALTLARKQLIAGDQMECKYKYCKEHNPSEKRKRRKRLECI